MEKFDQSQFAAALHRYQIEPATVPLQVFESLSSTNTTLWDLLNQGLAIGTVVIALQQQAGRGQWGRQWQSPLGGLYLSWSIAPNLPIHLAPQLTLASAWGIATTLRSLQIPVLIKWPNDLVLQGRKLGGILTETRLSAGNLTKAVVGVGINWCNQVPEPGISLHSYLAESAQVELPTLEVLAAIMVRGLRPGDQVWQQQGINGLLPAYTALLTHLGHSITIAGQTGTILGVTEMGELRVRLQAPTQPESNDIKPFNHDEITEIQLKPGTISLGYDLL